MNLEDAGFSSHVREGTVKALLHTKGLLFTGVEKTRTIVPCNFVDADVQRVSIDMRATMVPRGTFKCSKCAKERCDLSRSSALRLMPSGEEILYGGLVCPDCVEACPLEFGGWSGAVRRTRFEEWLDTSSSREVVCSTSDSVLVDMTRVGPIMERIREVDVSEVVAELAKRFRARRVRKAWKALVARKQVARLQAACFEAHRVFLDPCVLSQIAAFM